MEHGWLCHRKERDGEEMEVITRREEDTEVHSFQPGRKAIGPKGRINKRLINLFLLIVVRVNIFCE
jgi:hypothetical protein